MAKKTGGGCGLIAVLLALALVVAGVVTYRTGHWPFEKKDGPVGGDTAGAKTVDKKGGTFTFKAGLKIIVPAGAVDQKTTLTATQPRILPKGSAGPLKNIRSAAVGFDVSLVQGDNKDVQPKKPLSVTVPLRGAFAPAGSTDTNPLPYTADGKGGFLLLPYKDSKTAMNVEMSHLSPKYVAYVADKELLKSFDAAKAQSDRGSCSQQLTVSGEKIKFGPQSKGWDLKDDSAVFACLIKGSDGYVRVGMVNRIDYILSIAATKNVRVVPPEDGGSEAAIIKSLARNIFHLPKVKAYAALDEKLVGSIKVDDLPATIELQGDPHTYLAEAVWRALTVSVMVFIGEDGDQTAKLVKALIESVDTTTCLSDRLTANDQADWLKAVRAVIDCSSPIMDVLAKHLPSMDILKRAQAAWSMTLALTESLVRAGNGIKLQFTNTIRVQVERELNLNGFTGDWYVHGSKMVINADGTGTLVWNAGPCEKTGSQMCDGHSSLKVSPAANGFRVTRIDVRYTKSGTEEPYTPWYVGQDMGENKAGDTTVFTRVSDTAITEGERTGFGNPYMCRSDGPEAQDGTCG